MPRSRSAQPRLAAGLVGAIVGAAVLTATPLSPFARAIVDSPPASIVPIVPCRLADTRSTESVGPRKTPIHGGEAVTFAVRGTNGNCTIPDTATGVVTNMTATNPTTSGFLTAYPSDAATRPLSSNLNWTPTSPPTPNQVTVQLSASGAFNAFNSSGDIDLIVDVVGYLVAAGATSTPTPGPRGLSAWDTIPSGQTVTGVQSIGDGTYPVSIQSTDIMLPAKAPVALTSDMVNFAPDTYAQTTDDDPACTGKPQTPTAPPGKVCLYLVSYFTNDSNVRGLATGNLPTQAFIVQFTLNTAGSGGVDVVWAYTAP